MDCLPRKCQRIGIDVGKQVVPPISDPNKYSDHVKKALEDKVKRAQAKADKAWKPVPEARYTKGECKYLADKAIEVLWEKVREQQRAPRPVGELTSKPHRPFPVPFLAAGEAAALRPAARVPR